MACLVCKSNSILCEGVLICSEQRQRRKEEMEKSRMDFLY
jgi:hypothetical protein